MCHLKFFANNMAYISGRISRPLTIEALTHLEDISDEDGELPGVESGELLPALVARRAVVGVDRQEGQAHQPRVLGHRRRPDLERIQGFRVK